MAKQRIVGIDFGTSTTVMRVKIYDEGGKPVSEELHTYAVTFNNNGSTMVPTVMRCKNDNYVYGFEALKNYRNSTNYEVFKLDLQSEDEQKREEAERLTEMFFCYLHEEYQHQLSTGCLGDLDCEEVTLVSYPVKWKGPTRQFMIDAAKKAGFQQVAGMNEAEAAIKAITVQCKDVLAEEGFIEKDKPSNIMLIDMGAGTTDIVICRYTYGEDGKNEILTTWPQGGQIFFGGSMVDTRIKDFIIQKFPEEYRERIQNNIHLSETKEWKESLLSPALKRRERVTEFSPAENVANLLDIDMEDFTLDRYSFENMFEDYIREFVELVKGAIGDCEIGAEDIDLVILTGGHSQWYFLRDVLLDVNGRFEALGMKKLKDNPERVLAVAAPQETVALGLVYSKIKGDIFHDDCLIAYYYATGEGGYDKDLDKAIEMYKASAARNNNKAVYNLGVCFYEKQDFENAVKYFKSASALGYGESTFNLGVCYWNGLGITEDTRQAKRLFEKAYAQGYEQAKEVLDSINEKSTAAARTARPEREENIDTQADDVQWEDICLPTKEFFENEQSLSINGSSRVKTMKNISAQAVKAFLLQFDEVTLPLEESFICGNVVSNNRYGFVMTDKYIYVNKRVASYRLALDEIEEFRVQTKEERGTKTNLFLLITINGEEYIWESVSGSLEALTKQTRNDFEKLELYKNMR